MKDSEIVITSIGKTLFESNQLLPNQEEVIKQCRFFVEQFRAGSLRARAVDEYPWYHELDQPTQVVSMIGERGSGKSACLLTLCRELDDAVDNNGRKYYCVMPVISPESLSTEESLLDAFLINLLRLINWTKEGQMRGPAQPTTDANITSVRQRIASILEAQLAWTKSGQQLIQDDAVTVERYTSTVVKYQAAFHRRAFLLHAALREFLEKVAHADVLVVPLDDVDLARNRSEEMLELIKVFLSHPRVSVILTCDLQTMRRSIRNQLLNQLPAIFAGGSAAKPEEGKEDGLASFFGPNKATLIADEYRQDDGYAQAYLFKVIPPAYRCELMGLTPAQCQFARFSLGDNTSISLHDVFLKIPTVVDLTNVVRKGNSGPDSKSTRSASSFIEDLINSENSTLSKICAAYIGLLSPNIRTLLNQIIFFYRLKEGYRARLKSLAQSSESPAEQSASIAPAGMFLRWNPAISADLRLGFDEKTSRSIQDAEAVMVMELIKGFALHPDIEGDRALFFNEREQCNVLNAKTIDIMWQQMGSIDCVGTGPLGAIFAHAFSGKKQYFSTASNALLSFIGDYAVLRTGSLWRILRELGLNMHTFFSEKIARVRFVEFMLKNVSLRDAVLDAFVNHLKMTTEFTHGLDDKNKINAAPRNSKLGPPIFLNSIRQAARYHIKASYFEHFKHYKEFLAEITENHEKLYENRKPDGNQGGDGVTGESFAHQQEMAFGLRLLGALYKRGLEEVVGLMHGLNGTDKEDFPPEASPGLQRRDSAWLAYEERASRWVICNILTTNGECSLIEMFLRLLYVSSLPLAPLVCAWCGKPSDPINTSMLINRCFQILTDVSHQQAHASWLRITLNAKFDEGEQLWKKIDRKRPPAAIEIDTFSAPLEVQNMLEDAPVRNLAFQAGAVPLFLDLLMAICNVDSFVDVDGCPRIWRSVVAFGIENTMPSNKKKTSSKVASSKKASK